MKYLIVMICFVLCLNSYSQTPSSMMNNVGLKNAGMAARNPWLGGQIGYKFGGSDEFADNLIASARLMYEIDLSSKKFQLPIMGNVSQLRDNLDLDLDDDIKDEARIQDLITSTQGVNLGLYPYYIWKQKNTLALIIHGVAAYKINAFKESEESTIYFQQGRFSVGVEAQIGKYDNSKGQYPWTISLAPTLTIFKKSDYTAIFGNEKSSISSLEITSVLPIGRGMGFLLEAIISDKSIIRTGLLLSSELTKNN